MRFMNKEDWSQSCMPSIAQPHGPGKTIWTLLTFFQSVFLYLHIRVAVSLWTVFAKGVISICWPQKGEQERPTDSTAHAHITGADCCVDHYFLNGKWWSTQQSVVIHTAIRIHTSHQDDSTWSLREIANTAKSLETKLQAGQEKLSLVSVLKPSKFSTKIMPRYQQHFISGIHN